MKEVSKHVVAFYEHIGRQCQTLGDLNWSKTNSYLDRIPKPIPRTGRLSSGVGEIT